MNTYKPDTLVTLKKEFLDSNEPYGIVYKVIEDRGDRLLVSEKDSKLGIAPSFCWSKNWVELV
jgi:hypothetical protein